MPTVTRYEFALSGPNGEKYLIAYSRNRSRRALINAMRDRKDAIDAITGAEHDWYTGERASEGIMIGAGPGSPPAWRAYCTGRTQLDIRTTGRELPYVREAVPAGNSPTMPSNIGTG